MKIFIGMWRLLPLHPQAGDITEINIDDVRAEVLREKKDLPASDDTRWPGNIIGEHTPAAFEKLFNEDNHDFITPGRFWIRIFDEH